MKRSILLALTVVLALTVSLGSVATAAPGDGAQASAKKGKGKAKGCKGKKGKGKAKGCKGKGASSGLPLTPGTYDGQDGVGLVFEGGKKASLEFVGGDSKTCVPFPIGTSATSVSSTATSFKASGESSSSLELKWSITVTPALKYKLVLDSSFVFPDQDPCDKPGAVFTGTLAKG
jgi:hypothetical protein